MNDPIKTLRGDAATFAPSPQRKPGRHALHTGKGFFVMVSALVRGARERKGFALWQVVRYAVAATYFWVGGTFLFGGGLVHIEPTYHLIENVEPGGIRMHGLILFVLAFLIASKPAWPRQTSLALLASLFYSLLSTGLIIGGWVLHKPDASAPAWYLLMAALSFALIASAPLTARSRGSRFGGPRA